MSDFTSETAPLAGEIFTQTIGAAGHVEIDLSLAANCPSYSSPERFWAGRMITINVTAQCVVAVGDGTTALAGNTAGPGLVAAGGAPILPGLGMRIRLPNTFGIAGQNAQVQQARNKLMFASTPGCVVSFWPSSRK